MTKTFSHYSFRNMQVLTSQYLKETSVKYHIALTKLSFFMFTNVLPHDIAKIREFVSNLLLISFR